MTTEPEDPPRILNRINLVLNRQKELKRLVPAK